MAEIIEQLKVWIESIVSSLGYPGIVLIMALENIFPPIPSELVMPFAGFLVVSGRYSLVGVVLAGMLGSVIGALVLYYFGRWADEVVIRSFLRRFGRYLGVSEKDLDVAMGYFARHGQVIVFFGRLIPLVRSLISIPAGMQRMPLGTFLLFTVLGTTTWCAILAYAGMVLGANWPAVIDFISQYQRVVLVLLAVAVVGFIAYRLRSRFMRPAMDRQ
jgi:membrane protein DedA with SNARE-associated domain